MWDCLEQMVQFVKIHNLRSIFGTGSDDEELENILRPLAEIASQLPMKLNYINDELSLQLSVMSLYDLAVLIGRFPFRIILQVLNSLEHF